MERPVISRKELAERWGCDESSVCRWEREGFIHQLNIPGAKYSMIEVQKLEGLEEKERNLMSPFERRKLLAENAGLRNKLNKLKSIIFDVSSIANAAVAEELRKEGIS